MFEKTTSLHAKLGVCLNPPTDLDKTFSETIRHGDHFIYSNKSLFFKCPFINKIVLYTAAKTGNYLMFLWLS